MIDFLKKIPGVRSGIGRRFILYILLFSSVITFIGTGLQLYLDFNRDLKAIHSTFKQIESSYLQSIINSLWVTDDEFLRVQLQGILKLPDMQFIEVRKETQVLQVVGTPQTESILERTIPLFYAYNDRNIHLGDLYVVASLKGVYGRILERVLVILGIQSIKTFLVSLFIFIIFYQLVGKYIIYMASFFKSMDFQSIDQPLHLERKSNTKEPDELNQLANAFNLMRKNLARDINRREIAEKELRESEEKFHNLYDNAPDMYVSVSPDDASILQCNKTLLDKTGYSSEEIIGYPIFKMYHEDCMDQVKKAFQQFVETGVVKDKELTLKRKDGSKMDVSLNTAAVRDDAGKILHSISSWRDVTDRKQVEEQLKIQQKILNKSQEIAHLGSWHLDIKKNVLTWSDEEYRIFGRTPQEFGATYDAFLETIHPDDRDMVDKTYTNAIENKVPYECVHRIIRHNGEERIVLEKSEDIVDESGKTIHSFGFTQDITEQKIAERRIKTSLREKEVLLKEIHHRVKNNMQVIISLLSLQKQHPSKNEVRSLDDIINRVRIFGDIHRRLYQQEDISKIDFVQHLKDNMRDLVSAYDVDKKNIQFELNIANPVFNLDQAVSCGLLMNELISNSLKHAFSGHGKIKISITHDADGELERISYSDNGKGIESSPEGFGIKIINALAEQLNMAVHIFSKEGTQFDFTRKDMAHPFEKTFGKIIYVEDEVIIALNRIAYLKENGYSVNENAITSGEQAVNYVKESTPKPSLILMDIGLKGDMSGIEAAKEIRKLIPSIPIIFLSGYEDANTQNQISSIPNTAFLNKLSTPEEMAQLINKYHK